MNRKTLFLFVFLFAYILLQISWWAYLLIQNGGVKNQSNILMVVGEGSVFLLVLMMGFVIVFRSIIKEVNLILQKQNMGLAITHELKTPLTAISLIIDTISTRDLSQQKKQHLCDQALLQANVLNGLIDQVLLSSKINQGQYALHKESFDLIHELKIILKKLENAYPNNTTEITSLPKSCMVFADRQSIGIVLSNIIENGQKYAGSAGKVSIQIKDKDDKKISIIISNNGPEIPSEEFANIFKQFYRIGDENTRSHKGTGMGLYLAKKFIEMHKGQIIVTSSPNNTHFEILLPKQ